MSKKFKCPRCGNYSVEKNPSPLLSMLGLDVIGFFGACILGGFGVIIFFILLFLTVITLIAGIIKLIINKRIITMYKCNSCGVELSEDKIDFNA